mgnify:CR=1 FL=1
MSTVPTSLFGALSSSRQGLFTNRKALSIAGQNIANVNTPGYSRQRANITSIHLLGGSNVTDIQRIRDLYLDQQRAISVGTLGFQESRDKALTQLEAIFDETLAPGPISLLDNFFASLQDLTLAPAGAPEREGVRATATSLINHIHNMRQRLGDLRAYQDNTLKTDLGAVNQIAAQIANLNGQIATASAAGLSVNELQDQRQEAVRQLAELTQIQAFNTSQGAFTLTVANGITLVEGTHYSELVSIINGDNDGLSNVGIRQANGNILDVTSRMTGGQIGGLLQARDVDIQAQIQNLDLFAARMVTQFNIQHRQGWNLATPPVQGIDFFQPVNVYYREAAANTGGARVTAASAADQSALTFDDYEIRFGAGGATYEIVNLTRGTTSGPLAYVSGTPIVFDGVSLTITDTAGAPADGDVFVVNTKTAAASAFSLSAALEADAGNIAASGDGVSGDNANALALTALRNLGVFSNGTQTFNDFLTTNQTALGVTTQRSHHEAEAQQLVVTQIDGFIESVSGVSIDEESTLLIQYERAFQACSRVISIVDEMLNMLLTVI